MSCTWSLVFELASVHQLGSTSFLAFSVDIIIISRILRIIPVAYLTYLKFLMLSLVTNKDHSQSEVFLGQPTRDGPDPGTTSHRQTNSSGLLGTELWQGSQVS